MGQSTVVVPPLQHDFSQGPDEIPSGSAISHANREVLERAKVELAMRPDFNLIDAFRIFDHNGTGQIST